MTSVHTRTILKNWVKICARCSSSSLSLRPTSGPGPQILKRGLSSKTSSSNSAVVVQTVESQLSKQPPAASAESSVLSPDHEDYLPTDRKATTSQQFQPAFSFQDIREMDEETRARIHQTSSEIAAAQSASLVNPKHLWRRKEILIMEEEEWKDTMVLKERPAMIDRRGEGTDYFFRTFSKDKDPNHIDQLAAIQWEIDLRPKNVKTVIAKHQLQGEIENQAYDPKRNRILGNDLAAAHFIVFRKGKVKFLGQNDWVKHYRLDNKDNLEEEDLPVMKEELCTLPIRYDPRYRVEAIDASGVKLHYEGLANFENLNHVKWLSLRESPYIDDWCVEKLARIFRDTLEFIDLSGCPRVSDRGIGVLHRCRNLKYIAVENLAHLENLGIVCAMLEDHNPNLQILGIDYEKQRDQLRLEAEKLKRMAEYEQKTERLKPHDDFKLTYNPDLITDMGLDDSEKLEGEQRRLLAAPAHKSLPSPTN